MEKEHRRQKARRALTLTLPELTNPRSQSSTVSVTNDAVTVYRCVCRGVPWSVGGRWMKQLIEDIAKALVDIPEEVAVRMVEGEQVTVLVLKVAPSDLGKVIGKHGRLAQSMRTILGAAGKKLNRRFTLEILDANAGLPITGKDRRAQAF
jgi:predicted RNA-binding protein YlqC (UPF0109 family)